jgi:hypothetical protein
MDRLTENNIILITRPTRLEELVTRWNTPEQARFYVESLGEDFSDYILENNVYRQAVDTLTQDLSALGRVQNVARSFLPNFIFGPHDTVVVTGQDGLVANTLKYLNGQPLVAVNPDPSRWDGQLLPFKVPEAAKVVKDVFKKASKYREITLAMAELPGGVKIYAVNDIFIGPRTHGSARYILTSGTQKETQSSSGVIISTGLGSSGWLASILAGAKGIWEMSRSYGLTGRDDDFESQTETDLPREVPGTRPGTFDWSADYLYFSVREPFPSQSTGTNLTFGRVDRRKPLVITSLMSLPGVIFTDGMEDDFWEFGSGQKAVISLADKKGKLIV